MRAFPGSLSPGVWGEGGPFSNLDPSPLCPVPHCEAGQSCPDAPQRLTGPCGARVRCTPPDTGEKGSSGRLSKPVSNGLKAKDTLKI